ncbi:hypothetical protein HMF7854_01015 [Sphingomonas ginkgonis]|uniref:HTH marR-type domain-containing protein n=1 Tax=Sphingomonas ginkgonis TaxID=2315330 RepID=A0A429V6K6_9SPHN|nr:hypothetical protein [Sphingomonas ginkgonis]RST29568.1 hypothetical protein HMF7854_01015 [Sphingomonas ginkgonis]
MQAEELARRFIAVRRNRDQRFGADLFGEPAWELLLTFFIAAAEQRSLSLVQAAGELGSSVPLIERWVAALQSRGLLDRMPDDEEDPLVRISADGEQLVRSVLDTSALYAPPEDGR